ncbi:MAG: class I SAM-dependent methyltransferase [Burkholderiales bacterium]|nr:class I SAM-dependent methyltransferase [Burkholderiales bacterium]
MFAARDCHARGVWPSAWPAPAQLASVWGVDLDPRRVRAGRLALGARAALEIGDLRTAAIPPSDAIVLLDVLHYVPPEAQRAVLARSRRALSDGGVLLLRVADAGAGMRFRLTSLADRIATVARGGPPRLYSRALPAWIALLTELGFGDVRSAPMSACTPFANVLLVAR